MNVYRFRKIENLLDKFQELEKQSIYFASPEELNDPMEGFRDIFWQGDKIVWDNFFRNYIPWLSETYLWLKYTDGSIKLEPDHIYPRKIWLDQLLNNICDTVFEKHELEQIPILCSHPSFLCKQESRPPAPPPLDAGSRPA